MVDLKRFTVFLTIILALFLGTEFASAYTQSEISDIELRAEMEFLCDSLHAGRKFGSPGEQLVTMYLVRQFRGQGLRTKVQTFRNLDKIGHNVVAITPGYFKRYIVVSAYYDGLGVLNGKVYPGADSNASGVAALLRLASRLKPIGSVGIIFVALDGHNASMSGAKEFVAKYRLEYNIERAVNMDIMGSDLVPVNKNRPEYLIALGALPMMSSIDRANRDYHLDISYDYYSSYSFTELFYEKISDQRYFLEADIPSIMFTSGITDHTNKTTDTIDTINFPLFAKRVNLILTWLKEIL